MKKKPDNPRTRKTETKKTGRILGNREINNERVWERQTDRQKQRLYIGQRDRVTYREKQTDR